MSAAGGGRFGNAFGRLVAEFLVIVVGVLVALAVDGYSSAQEDRARVETHLLQLESELTEMAEKVVLERADHDHAMQAVISLIEGVTNPGAVPTDTLDALVAQIFAGVNWEPEATVINTMVSSGDIALVSDQALQSELTRFRERVQAVTRRRNFAEEMIVDGFWVLTESADMLRWASSRFGTTPTGERWDWTALSDDLAFRNGLYGIANGIRNHVAALDQLESHIGTLQSALDEGP